MAVSLNIVYTILYGSHAYGTATPDSDRDIRGIFIPDVDEYVSLEEIKDIRKMTQYADVVMHPIHKFFSLAMKGNPSVLEWLYIPDNCIEYMNIFGEALRDIRHNFISKQIYPRFKGYAHAEFSSLQKMTGTTGEKRKKQIQEFGYSPKNAMNCIRLLQQGTELLTKHTVTFPRPNADVLLRIKEGKVGYQTIQHIFENELRLLDEAYEKSSLPEKVDVDKLNKFMIKLVRIHDEWINGLGEIDYWDAEDLIATEVRKLDA
jgi:uncharacterized protein